jgi:ABC-2 type transport system permease protein
VVFGATAPVGDPSGLDQYALYLLSGLLPWAFFTLVTSLGLTSLIGNAGLIRKVAFSRETLVFAQSIFSLVQFSIEISVLTIILAACGGRPLVWLPVTVVLMLLLCAFATGIGLILASIAVYFRDLLHLWGIIVQVYFFTVPVIWNVETMKDRLSPLQFDLLTWNPMAVFVRSFRDTLYDGRNPGAGQIIYVLVSSVLSLTFGFWVFNRLGRRTAEEL